MRVVADPDGLPFEHDIHDDNTVAFSPDPSALPLPHHLGDGLLIFEGEV